ncbi:MAG: thioredoxin-dependent thiol peroxidase, partial [Bdellovibrionales bacterium]|nr:thioredoxin-dependent thiol peroxidase [Bdellovibrionales bacterium]
MGGVKELTEGKKAPAFSLPDQNGEMLRLSAIDTEYTVLFFYPKDSTPGCTIEAKGLSDNNSQFKKLGATVVGLSGGDTTSKHKFCSKYNLKVRLVADEDFAVAKKYGVFGKKSFMGKTFDGIHRTTFVLDRNKKILKVFSKVKPAD